VSTTSYGYDGPEDWQVDAFNEGHPKCECGCGERLCLYGVVCTGGCDYGYEAPGFVYDGLAFCEGEASDEARATLAEDIAREMAHGRGERCVVEGCAHCSTARTWTSSRDIHDMPPGFERAVRS
jgi:hypothetical protein